jgi:hypothetical protein
VVAENGVRSHLSRSAEQQLEVTDDGSMVMHCRIRWTGPCSYVLYDPHYPKAPDYVSKSPYDSIAVTIVAIDGQGYDYEAVLNGNTLLMDRGRMSFLP